MTDSGKKVRFSHLGFFVTDIDKQAEFYKSLLDFTETDRGQLATEAGRIDLVFLSKDPDEHHQLVLVSGRPEHLAFNNINQISFKADSIETLRELYQSLGSAPVTDVAPVTHGNALSVYFRDPEGNRIELYVDLPWYVSQPARVPAPVDLPTAELLAWAEAHARTLPGFRPRSEWRGDMARRMRVTA